MSVSFASYEIARSGLVVNERGLYVTGHNLSNVNTPGYVRQQAMIKNGPVQTTYTKYGIMQLGLGADIQEIRQIRHTFLDNVYRQENTTLGYWESKTKTFQDVQAIMAEPMNSGLQSTLNQFWDSWQELSKEPDSLTVRALVRQRGDALVQQINHMGAQLDSLQNDLNDEIRVRIDEVNQITSQIASLNVTILKNEVSGDSANDYRDQRNNLLDRLSKLVNAEVTEMQDGQVDVTLGGYFVVQKGISTDLYAAERNPGELFYVPKLAGTNIEIPLRNGIIKGLMESRGEVSGAVGGAENGTPNTKADVVFLVDSDVTLDSAYINEYKNEMLKKGIDVNIITPAPFAAGSFADITTGINNIPGLRSDANKYVMIFTNNTAASPAELTAMTAALKDKGLEASVVTDAASPGDWTSVVNATGGHIYDVNSADYTSLMGTMAEDTNRDVNDGISMLPVSQNIVSDLRQRLNAMVNILLRQINYMHKSGMTMGDPPVSGGDFFTVINTGRPLEMGNIRLNPNLSDLNNIAASQTGDNGDNSNALAIANLRNEPLLQDVNAFLSVDDYYQSIILTIGNSGSNAANIADGQDKLVKSADAYRQSITGVSMDEEMTNMIKYKFAYDASSRCINVIDQMMETIISRMGIAGR
jgi:flagellar hook-associated protein 1 FlgK